MLAVMVIDQGDAVRLAQAEALRTIAVEGRDGRNVQQAADETGEDFGKTEFVFDTEVKRDVFVAVVVVVDLHLIEDVGVEGEVVGAVGRFQKRVDIEDHDHLVGMFGADEGVPVGDVGLLVQGRNRRFAMAGGEA